MFNISIYVWEDLQNFNDIFNIVSLRFSPADAKPQTDQIFILGVHCNTSNTKIYGELFSKVTTNIIIYSDWFNFVIKFGIKGLRTLWDVCLNHLHFITYYYLSYLLSFSSVATNFKSKAPLKSTLITLAPVQMWIWIWCDEYDDLAFVLACHVTLLFKASLQKMKFYLKNLLTRFIHNQ